MTRVLIPSVDSSLGMQLLPTLLSIIAGSVDAIGFVGLGGLFTAHVTGNLVILAAHLVSGDEASVAPMLSVLVFMLVLGLTRLLVGGLESIGRTSLRPLLLLQLLLLAGFLVICRFRRASPRSGRTDRDPRGHARRLGDGCAKRTRAGLAEGRTVHRGHDDKHHAFHDGCR
jgi:hypothetical protein